MELYILRHAIAVQRGSSPDSDRALTRQGRRKLQLVLARAAQAGVSPSLILSSPYRRALETAEIAAQSLHYRQKIVVTDALLPDASPAAFWQEVRAHRDEGALLTAGHEPMLSATVASLLGVPALKMDLKKGALVRIDLEQFGAHPHGLLRWMLTPRLAGGDSE
jgi:phosphohistidine phosphatase